MFKYLQSLGKALMLPIAVMPIAALLLRLGAPDVFDIAFMSKAGASIFDNLPILFAIGVAVGLAKDNAGAAGLAGAIGHFVIINGAQAIDPSINMGVFSGIIGGVVAGMCYNKFHNIQLPEFLGFFAGRRFVPIITATICVVLAGILGHVWPAIQGGLNTGATWMAATGSIGLFIFGIFNRLLLPVGLHHVLNSYVWFLYGTFNGKTGDLNRFFVGDPSAGQFMAGFYPIMMVGLPMAALAMIAAAKPQNRKRVTGMLVSIGFTSFLTGITEPIEFTFMFLAPVLYGIHAVLTGASLAIVNALNIKHGFGFSAGLIDFLLNKGIADKANATNHNPYGVMTLLVICLVFGAIYFVVFYGAIKVFNLPTPGNEADEDVVVSSNKNKLDSNEEVLKFAQALGGIKNLTSIDSCITRLRLEAIDRDIIDDKELKALGAKGILRPGKSSVQVILGAKAEIIAQALREL